MLEERRKDYPDILSRLNELDKAQSILQALQEKDLEIAEEWRIKFCKKVETIQDSINKLPCDLRQGWYSSMGKQMRFMWWVISGMIMTLLIIFGTSVSVVNAIKDEISFIKQHSYKVNDYYKEKR